MGCICLHSRAFCASRYQRVAGGAEAQEGQPRISEQHAHRGRSTDAGGGGSAASRGGGAALLGGGPGIPGIPGRGGPLPFFGGLGSLLSPPLPPPKRLGRLRRRSQAHQQADLLRLKSANSACFLMQSQKSTWRSVRRHVKAPAPSHSVLRQRRAVSRRTSWGLRGRVPRPQ